MKKVVIACAVSLLATSAFAALSSDEVKRLTDAGAIVNELRSAPDKGIPEELWDKAECVVVIPGLKKGAFVVGGEYGSGVMSCRKGAEWSAPVFMQMMKGSWGLQIGGQETDLVLLIMNRRGLDKLLQDKVSLGADASVAAGPVGRTGAAATDAQLHAEMLTYSRSRGVFAGVDLSGGVLKPDNNAIERAYGKNANARDIAMGTAHVATPQPATAFLRSLKNSETRATTGQK
ncbi:MAG TPA: lipid-binding SYLF domain-containing protein [Vicinamibacterales bacterium]|jgi:lipid-binding SYLF domain-containing protein